MKRWLVVGASSGIGRAVAVAASRAGARVALAARREDRLQALVREQPGCVALAADVSRPADCRRMLDEAAAALGGLDVLVYAAGISQLRPIAETTPEEWRAGFEVNLFGAVRVVQAALPHLSEAGIVALLSSDAVGRPRQGLAIYTASKAALDSTLLSWRREHPGRRFLRVVIGPTVGTEFLEGEELARAAALLPDWIAQGFMTRQHMQAEELGALLVGVLGTALEHPDIALEDLCLQPPGGWLRPLEPAAGQEQAPEEER